MPAYHAVKGKFFLMDLTAMFCGLRMIGTFYTAFLMKIWNTGKNLSPYLRYSVQSNLSVLEINVATVHRYKAIMP